MRRLALSDEILLSVQQPARYIGGEVNMCIKNPSQVDIRFAMCFPDVYEIGMSHLGMQILYDMFNRRDDVYCVRVFSPDGSGPADASGADTLVCSGIPGSCQKL